MNKREVICRVLDGKRPPYVPWSLGFTHDARVKLVEAVGEKPLEALLDDHFMSFCDSLGGFTDMGNGRFRDSFGVVWDRSVDQDIGVVEGLVLPEPTVQDYHLPLPMDGDLDHLPSMFSSCEPRFRIFSIGFSLYERAWTLRGMENLMMDFYDNPQFVHDLLGMIADHNLLRVRRALEHDIDGVYFGDDWGQQQGLQMGPGLWREFIRPCLARMYGEVRRAGQRVFIHSCGDVDELFDDLVEIGINCFNPFQPEVMDVYELLPRYRGRLSFHGGLSTQRILPYGTTEEVRTETRRLIELGRNGGYIFAPAHAVEGDVPVENMLAFIEEIRAQPGYPSMAPAGVCGATAS